MIIQYYNALCNDQFYEVLLYLYNPGLSISGLCTVHL